MYTIIGSCPRCGSPIYTYSVWMSVTPPPPIHSCGCFPRPQTITTTTTEILITPYEHPTTTKDTDQ